MGNLGSYTAKATIKPQLYLFTKWGSNELRDFLVRGHKELPETFGLRRHEFEHLVGAEEIGLPAARSLFRDVFDTDHNGLVDKMEVMCMICMTSKVPTREKVEFFFDLFNFNSKGYLNESELTLLIMAVSRGAFKVDQKFYPPPVKLIHEMVSSAFSTHAKYCPGTLRKPELVLFVTENPDISAYLECWRGHAAQVLLNKDEKWRDLSFPCNETSIAPSKHWYRTGLPPTSFVKWRRRDRIGGGMGMLRLFSHTESFLKTIDRRRTYLGDGVLGTGALIQGYLADLWLLNAMAAMTSRPDLLFYNFATTGQEEEGRFCVRLYEGGGWRTVYVDDRFPCSITNQAMFARSTSSTEAWVCILEKAVAKYLGSYGQVGSCSTRSDAVLTSLRLLTGGHVLKLSVRDYEWRSISEECTGPDGHGYVLARLKEGSVVAFGRSVGTTLTALDKFFASSAMHLPPIGRLFPVVGTKEVQGYMNFILRDSWGLIGDSQFDINVESGHSNTFLIRIEDISLYFDTLIVSRFPDSLRATATRHQLQPWKTEVYSAVTQGVQRPAAFRIVVKKKPAAATGNSQQHGGTRKKNKFAETAEEIDAILAAADEAENVVKDDFPIVRLKERYDFSRNQVAKDGYTPGGKKVQEKAATKEVPKSASSKRRQQAINAGLALQNKADLVDVSLTLSSACDWSFAGSSTAAAQLRARLVPTFETLRTISQRQEELQRVTEQADAAKKAQEKRLAKLLEVDDGDGQQSKGSDSKSTGDKSSRPSGIASGSGGAAGGAHPLSMNITSPRAPLVNNRPPAASSSSATVTSDSSNHGNTTKALDPQSFDLAMAVQRSWVAQSMDLVPGEYYLFADIQFAVPYTAARLSSLPRDIAEAPWLEANLLALHQRNTLYFDAEGAELRNNGVVDDDVSSVRSLTSLAQLESKIFQLNHALQEQPTLAGMISTADLEQKQQKLLLNNDTDNQDPLTHQLPHHIWLEATTLDDIEVTAVSFEELAKLAQPLPQYSPMFPVEVPEETWPFCVEIQQDVASRCLVNAMATIREEAESAGEEFIKLVSKFKEERKKTLRKQHEQQQWQQQQQQQQQQERA